MKNTLFFLFALTILAVSCGKDEPQVMTKNFTVTIENTSEPKDYFATGTTGVIMPGQSASFSFDAGIGHYLQFGTMFVQSNDLFISPGDEGLALYNNRMPLTGDITSMLRLWDAGTEVNEEPGVGPNQPPRQSGPNTGMDENGLVHLVNDAFSYPMINQIVKVSLSHDGGTKFTLMIENISDNSAIPTPLAPGTWVVHAQGQKPMFTDGSAASPGLEALAEDGDITKMNNNLSSKSGFHTPYAPGAYSISMTNEIFMTGQSAGSALEALAEDGNVSGFANVFNTPDGASGPGPLMPGASYSFSFSAQEGDRLSMALMLVQSNDWFVGLDNVALFSSGTALNGNLSNLVRLYDAGTEMDEYAGAGNNQPFRQMGANTGQAENGNIAIESSPGAHVPAITDLIKVSISSN